MAPSGGTGIMTADPPGVDPFEPRQLDLPRIVPVAVVIQPRDCYRSRSEGLGLEIDPTVPRLPRQLLVTFVDADDLATGEVEITIPVEGFGPHVIALETPGDG